MDVDFGWVRRPVRRFAFLSMPVVFALSCSTANTDFGQSSNRVPRHRPLFTRTTGAVTIRASAWTALRQGPALALSLSDDAAVATADAVDSAGPTGVLRLVKASSFGVAEGGAASWLAVRVPGEATMVQARFGDGYVDRMSPHDRWGVLSRPGVAGPATLAALAADGHTISTIQTPGLVPCAPRTDSPPTCGAGLRPLAIIDRSGVRIRAYASDPASKIAWFELSTPTSIETINASLDIQPQTGLLTVVAARGQRSGRSVDRPAAIVVHVNQPVASLRARFVDGTSDAMTPIQGWAVLVNNANEARGTVDALDSTGRLLGERKVEGPWPLSA